MCLSMSMCFAVVFFAMLVLWNTKQSCEITKIGTIIKGYQDVGSFGGVGVGRGRREVSTKIVMMICSYLTVTQGFGNPQWVCIQIHQPYFLFGPFSLCVFLATQKIKLLGV